MASAEATLSQLRRKWFKTQRWIGFFLHFKTQNTSMSHWSPIRITSFEFDCKNMFHNGYIFIWNRRTCNPWIPLEIECTFCRRNKISMNSVFLRTQKNYPQNRIFAFFRSQSYGYLNFPIFILLFCISHLIQRFSEKLHFLCFHLYLIWLNASAVIIRQKTILLTSGIVNPMTWQSITVLGAVHLLSLYLVH